MSAHQSSYRQLLKATSIFGGVQFVNILVQIVKSKAVAVLLGPAGMGIHSLLMATQELIANLTNFGLGISGVKDVAAAAGTGNDVRIATLVKVLQRWIWITGLLGAVVMLALSPLISRFTFGNADYTVAYAWMAITLLFNQLGAGKMVVLQGLRKIKYLANAGISGSFLGLTVSLPLYYYFGIDGIVPAIIATSVVNMLRSWYFASKVKLVPVTVDRVTTLKEGKEMLWLGFMLSLSGLITTAAAYLLRIYIRETGGVDDVGLYNAGFAIIITYVGLVFTAMSTDYYPRLSGVALYNHKARKLINQQAEMAILILAPILLLLMVFIKWVVVLLYSSQFVSVSAMIQWATLGMFFKAASWSIAYVFLAKGEAKLFLWNELITNAYLLAFNVLGYKLMGLDGLGIAFLLSYVLYFGQVFLITRYKYRFRLSRSFLRIMAVQFSLALLCLLFVKLTSAPVSYIAGSVLILIASVFSVYQLNKKTGLLKRRPDLTHHHNHD